MVHLIILFCYFQDQKKEEALKGHKKLTESIILILPIHTGQP